TAGHDAPVRACELVGQGDQRAARGVVRVTVGTQPARYLPAGDPARELLDDELRGMAAPVAADVDDQRLAAHLGPQVAVEVRPALPHHVGHVQVADLAVGPGADELAAAGPPVLVAEPPVA